MLGIHGPFGRYGPCSELVVKNCRSQLDCQCTQLLPSWNFSERERDPSGCRASGLTPELPVHVVLIPTLLVPPLLVPPLLVPPLLVPPLLVPPLLVPPLLVPPLLVPPLLVPPLLVPPLLVPPLLVPPLLVQPLLHFQALVPPLLRLQALVPMMQRQPHRGLLFYRLLSEVSSSPAVVVTKKLRILLVPATALSSRRFFSRFFCSTGTIGRLSDGYITIKLNKTSFNCSRHNCINQYSIRYFLIITEYLTNQNKNAHSHADWSLCAFYASSFNCAPASWVHDIEECNSPASARGSTIFTIRFCFGIARVLDHSLWYADRLIAQLNGCASSTLQACAPMRWRRTNISQVTCTQKISTLLGGPFHSGAPRLCLPCLPYRDATARICWCPQLHVGRPGYSNPCWCQLLLNTGDYMTEYRGLDEEDHCLAGLPCDLFPSTLPCKVVSVRILFAPTTKGVTMHRCIDASRYLGRRYVYRIVTQVSRY